MQLLAALAELNGTGVPLTQFFVEKDAASEFAFLGTLM